MTRTVKPAGVRREEILDAAEALILAKGYGRMTIHDVLREVGIAKGTLYHHFASKEAILRGIVERETVTMVQRARAAAVVERPALERLLYVIGSMRVAESPGAQVLSEHFNATRDADFHLLALNEMLRLGAPVLAEVIADGVASGEFDCEDPLGLAEIIITLAGTLMDEGVVASDSDEAARRQATVLLAVARCLGVDVDQIVQIMGAQKQEGHVA